MVRGTATDVVHDFLGSAQIFTNAVNDLMEEQLHEVADDRLTFSQLKLLKMVSLTDNYTVSDVAAFLGVSNAAASRAVDRLVKRGLVDRAEAEADRRAVRLSLTATGRQLLERYDAASERVLQILFGDLSQDQLRRTAKLLDQLSVTIVERSAERSEVCMRCGIHFRDRCLLRQSREHNCHFHQHTGKGNGNSAPGGKRAKQGSQ
ncbi:MAG: MarR family transcriptional regulator [Gemmatimonadales bacterium]|nr:MarR family transcriptional regulator [Gemmatimonadales bacterium]